MGAKDSSQPAPSAASSQQLDWTENSTKIVLGSDENHSKLTISSDYGAGFEVPNDPIDLLQTVQHPRDTTLDGMHAASLTEKHFVDLHQPFESDAQERAA